VERRGRSVEASVLTLGADCKQGAPLRAGKTMATRRERVAVVVSVVGAVVSLVSALAMIDHVSLTKIITLWFGGFGTGAAVVQLVRRMR
jgi:hypothetical protein